MGIGVPAHLADPGGDLVPQGHGPQTFERFSIGVFDSMDVVPEEPEFSYQKKGGGPCPKGSPNVFAKGLKVRQSHSIGLPVTNITYSFFPEIVRGIEQYAGERGFNVMLTDSNGSPGPS